MTDKEPIIVHGVDVTKCDRLNLASAYGWDDPAMCSISCCKNGPNCLFKQLARKTQECEELKERLVRTEEDLKYQCVDCMNVKSDRYRKALEEIEGLVKNFCKDCDDYEDCNWDKEGCYYSLIPNLKDIINKAKGEE